MNIDKYKIIDNYFVRGYLPHNKQTFSDEGSDKYLNIFYYLIKYDF